MSKRTGQHLAAAVCIGLALRFVTGLEPVWWAAWFVPGLLLALALRVGRGAARGYAALSAAIGVSVNAPFFLSVMPAGPALLVMALQTLLWMFVIGHARRLVLSFDHASSLLALPATAVCADTLLAHLTPDGNWGSLAYTQAEQLSVVQVASVFGVGGILFVLMLVNSAVALTIHFGTRLRGLRRGLVAVAALGVATVGLGALRLGRAQTSPPAGRPMSFGMVSIDDFVADADNGLSRQVWQRYADRIAELATQGARIVLLPEKINVLSTAETPAFEKRLAAIAREEHVWLIAGLGVDTGAERRNEAWWFTPEGALWTRYRKHFMAPPEREFVPGDQFPVHRIEGVGYGVAICKDMHFASLGRDFGARGAGVMLVPAWDFGRDAWLEANTTKLRGVENGYTIVRASREGLLSVSDAYGRMVAVEQSAPLPGASLLTSAVVGPRLPTVYMRIGDVLGFLCVAWVALLTALTLRRSQGGPDTSG